MTLPTKSKYDPTLAISDGSGNPSQRFRNYMTQADALLTALAAGNAPGLTNAVNDAAAAKAGVAVGQLYRNGNALQVRLI